MTKNAKMTDWNWQGKVWDVSILPGMWHISLKFGYKDYIMLLDRWAKNKQKETAENDQQCKNNRLNLAEKVWDISMLLWCYMRVDY
jgi:hypothetical protein